MSTRETPMTHRYWERVRGTLLEECLVVPRRPGVGQRLIDAVIIEDGAHRVASRAESASLNLNGHDIVVVQTKAARLGMYLLGQAFFSRELIKDRFAPKSVRTVALCATDDAVLHPIAERFGVEVVVDDLAATPTEGDITTATRHRGMTARSSTRPVRRIVLMGVRGSAQRPQTAAAQRTDRLVRGQLGRDYRAPR